MTAAEEVGERLQQVRQQWPDADHWAYAYVLQAGTEGASDGGEPPGTAGRPLLAALKRCGATYSLVAVARYFGGIKLGTAGLAQAYRRCGEAALAAAQWGRLEAGQWLTLELGYAEFARYRGWLEARAQWQAPRFGERVTLSGWVPADKVEAVRRQLEAWGTAAVWAAASWRVVPLPDGARP